MATAVQTSKRQISEAATDVGPAMSKEALMKKLQSEKGLLPATWLSLYTLEASNGKSQVETLNILESAIVNVPAPTKEAVEARPSLVQEYNVLWVKFSNAIRREPIEGARKIFEKMATHDSIKVNAYFYSAWSFVESSFNQLEQARRVLLLGIERRASPSKQLQLALQRLSPSDPVVVPGTPHDAEHALVQEVAAAVSAPTAKKTTMVDKENAVSMNHDNKVNPPAVQTVQLTKRPTRSAAKDNAENGPAQLNGSHHSGAAPAPAPKENPVAPSAAGAAPQRKSADRPRVALQDLPVTAKKESAAVKAEPKPQAAAVKEVKLEESIPAITAPAAAAGAAPTPGTAAQNDASKRKRDFTRLAPLRRLAGGGAQRVLTQESPQQSNKEGIEPNEPLSPYQHKAQSQLVDDEPELALPSASEAPIAPIVNVPAAPAKAELAAVASTTKGSSSKTGSARARDQRSLSVPTSGSPFKPNKDLLERMDQLLNDNAPSAAAKNVAVYPNASALNNPASINFNASAPMPVPSAVPASAALHLTASVTEDQDSFLYKSPPKEGGHRPHAKSVGSLPEISPHDLRPAPTPALNTAAKVNIISPPTPLNVPVAGVKAPSATPMMNAPDKVASLVVTSNPPAGQTTSINGKRPGDFASRSSSTAHEELHFTDHIRISDWDKNCFVVNGRPYIDLGRVGRGGSSEVFKALSQDGNIYAIKKVDLRECDANTKQGYVEEIKLLEKLRQYECIIKMVDSEMNGRSNMLYIVLEFAEIDLAKMLARHPGGLYKTAENYMRLYWQQMCEAVAIVHEEERIVHGDIKPQNFVSVQGFLKLIDFGIAKALDADTTHIGRDNLVGTLNYLAPETLKFSSQRQSKYGRPSDIWALGCILYQMVYGRPPFHGLHTFQTISALSDPNLKVTLPLIDSEPLPSDLANVLAGCLNREPTKRPTIRQLLQHPFLHPFVAQKKSLKPPSAAASTTAKLHQ